MKTDHPLPDAALKGHIAVVGMTGGGKTFTTKGIVEHILAKDPAARVCVLDPIKSDWWGITSSANGKRPGLPFHILGGPRGHVPLHETTGKAIGELVGSGSLPLSIIDMADFGPGGLQAFFNDFAPALLRKIRGVVHLVLEEAHEFAPKERAGFGGETMTVHFAKKLATAGRSKGIRIIAATQRTQQLHNSVLGSCQTVIAHQLTYPADIEPVSKWFKGHVDKEVFGRFLETLTSLPTGTGWLCSGQAKVAEMVRFPPIWTFDNSATPDSSTSDLDVATAPVDRDKLVAIMGDAVKEAEANDPATLKKRIKELEAEVAKKPAATVDEDAIRSARQTAYGDGFRAGRDDAARLVREMYGERIRTFTDAVQAACAGLLAPMPHLPSAEPTPGIVHRRQPFAPSPASTAAAKAPSTPPSGASARPPSTTGERGPILPRGEKACMICIAQQPGGATREQLTVVTGYKRSSRDAYLQRLREKGYIEQGGDRLTATTAGIEALGADYAPLPTGQALRDFHLQRLPEGERRVLACLIDAYPDGLARDAIDESTGYKRSSRDAYIQRLSARQLVTTGGGSVRASDILFAER
ncbi:helicase HerA domain-containing protein [Reyranella massiliensis]|uniref:helicase HerA domain-containing protein n=1 Tax=Reyranella massiliensis TaxID=445220 RepID=UPI000309E80A|nr:DUF87 domain-containing protein [Reyranella massiliensis]